MNDKDVLLKFGKFIQERRKEKNLTQEDLAFSSGMDRSYIGSVERGERNISIINIYKIFKSLGVNSYDFN